MNLGTLARLPANIRQHVSSFLPNKGIAHLSSVNRQANKELSHPRVSNKKPFYDGVIHARFNSYFKKTLVTATICKDQLGSPHLLIALQANENLSLYLNHWNAKLCCC